MPSVPNVLELERCVELGWNASVVKTWERLATCNPAVTTNFTLLKPLLPFLQCNVVSATQNDFSQSVWPTLLLIVDSWRPNPPPMMDIDADPVEARLTWMSKQTRVLSSENPSVMLDESIPNVKANLLVLGFWAPALQTVHESEIQLVLSHAVSPTLAQAEPDPIIVPSREILYDPLATTLEFEIMLAALSAKEKEALKLPEDVQAEIDTLWLIITPPVAKQFNAEAEIQLVNSQEVRPTCIVGVKALNPTPLPRRVRRVEPVPGWFPISTRLAVDDATDSRPDTLPALALTVNEMRFDFEMKIPTWHDKAVSECHPVRSQEVTPFLTIAVGHQCPELAP
jgi:hypothetical protein